MLRNIVSLNEAEKIICHLMGYTKSISLNGEVNETDFKVEKNKVVREIQTFDLNKTRYCIDALSYNLQNVQRKLLIWEKASSNTWWVQGNRLLLEHMSALEFQLKQHQHHLEDNLKLREFLS